MHKLFMIVLVAAVAATPALADLVPLSGPMPAGSWKYEFKEFVDASYPPFTQMEIYRTSSGSGTSIFEPNGFVDFTSGSSWTGALLDSGHAVAWGPSITSLDFGIHFSGTASDSVAFDFWVWNGDTAVDYAHAEWNGATWSIDCCLAKAPLPPSRTAVPEGLSWPLMSASSLIALAGLARRRAKGG